MPEPIEFHPSSWMSWQDCDHQFDLTVLRREPPAYRHPAALNGSAIHAVVERVHREVLWDEPAEVLARLWADEFRAAADRPVRAEDVGVPVRWGALEGVDKAMDEYRADALEMIEGYRRDPENRVANLLVTEASWRAAIHGELWAGTIDQVREMPDGRAWVVDLKTNSQRPGATFLTLHPQLLAYAVALRHAQFQPLANSQSRGWRPLSLDVARVSWLHMRDYLEPKRKVKNPAPRPRFHTVEVTPRALESALTEMGHFVEAVKAGRFPRRPSSMKCGMCKVAAVCLLGFRGEMDYVDGGIDPGAMSAPIYEEE